MKVCWFCKNKAGCFWKNTKTFPYDADTNRPSQPFLALSPALQSKKLEGVPSADTLAVTLTPLYLAFIHCLSSCELKAALQVPPPPPLLLLYPHNNLGTESDQPRLRTPKMPPASTVPNNHAGGFWVLLHFILGRGKTKLSSRLPGESPFS